MNLLEASEDAGKSTNLTAKAFKPRSRASALGCPLLRPPRPQAWQTPSTGTSSAQQWPGVLRARPDPVAPDPGRRLPGELEAAAAQGSGQHWGQGLGHCQRLQSLPLVKLKAAGGWHQTGHWPRRRPFLLPRRAEPGALLTGAGQLVSSHRAEQAAPARTQVALAKEAQPLAALSPWHPPPTLQAQARALRSAVS